MLCPRRYLLESPPKVTFSDAAGTAVYHLGPRNTRLLTCCVVREPPPVWHAFLFFLLLYFSLDVTQRKMSLSELRYFPSSNSLLLQNIYTVKPNTLFIVENVQVSVLWGA